MNYLKIDSNFSGVLRSYQKRHIFLIPNAIEPVLVLTKVQWIHPIWAFVFATSYLNWIASHLNFLIPLSLSMTCTLQSWPLGALIRNILCKSTRMHFLIPFKLYFFGAGSFIAISHSAWHFPKLRAIPGIPLGVSGCSGLIIRSN